MLALPGNQLFCALMCRHCFDMSNGGTLLLASSTVKNVSGFSDFLEKGCVINIAMSFITIRGFSRSFFPFSTVLSVMRAPR